MERVCTDRYEGFANAAREVFPQAHVVVDRLQVAQAYREGVDTLRKVELKRLHDLDPDEDAALFKRFDLSPALHQPRPCTKPNILRESLTWVFDLGPCQGAGPAGNPALV